MTRHALIILTSHGQIGDTGRPTGFYWEELAVPYWALRDAGFEVTLASVAGGRPPADPSSEKGAAPAVGRFRGDETAMAALGQTTPVADIDGTRFDVVYLPGGHGTMWDLAQTPAVAATVAAAWQAGAVVGAVCHGPAGLTEVMIDGTPLVAGRRVNGFTDAEERAVNLEGTVPFLLESRLRERGARFEGNPEPFGAHAVRDGRLVTGQNPASSERVAALLIEAAEENRRAA